VALNLPPISIGGRRSLATNEVELRALLRQLIEKNIAIMSRGKPGDFPAIATTRVRYHREPTGMEIWQTADQLLRTGFGDCEDLAAYEAARLVLKGVRAQGHLKRVNGGYHVQVLIDGSRIWDPSAALGMGRAPI